MSKPEWGIKRTCQSCEASFYDLKKDPIICPKCLTVYDEKALIEKHRVERDSEFEDIKRIEEDGNFNDDDFFLETPSELLETLEEFEAEFQDKNALNG